MIPGDAPPDFAGIQLMRTLRLLLIVAFAATVAACASTKHPIGISAGPQTDQRLLGAWKGTDPDQGNTIYAFILPRRDAPGLEAVAVSPQHGDDKGGWSILSIAVGRAGEFRFLNARMLFDNGKPAKPGDDYVPVLYRIEGDKLYISNPDIDAIKRAVQAGELAGTTTESSVVITAEPAALDAYMARHAAKLFKPSKTVLRRMN
jgi:hypothetical protein